jgi:hypothetical protein
LTYLHQGGRGVHVIDWGEGVRVDGGERGGVNVGGIGAES